MVLNLFRAYRERGREKKRIEEERRRIINAVFYKVNPASEEYEAGKIRLFELDRAEARLKNEKRFGLYVALRSLFEY